MPGGEAEREFNPNPSARWINPGTKQTHIAPALLRGLRVPVEVGAVQGTCRRRKNRPVTSTSNSFTMVSESAVNWGPVAVQVTRSGDASKT